jgi:predicted lipoprotein with Yx(FWY)xxD motif
MKRTHVILAVTLATIASGSTVAAAQSAGASPTARTSRSTEVILRHTSVGTILTTSSGFTLYEFTRDRANENSCVKVRGCSQAWPALEASGRPTAGSGVKASLLSTIRISGGAEQVTYDGHALYTYIGDSAGQTSYVGVDAFGGDWDAVSAAGHAVK